MFYKIGIVKISQKNNPIVDDFLGAFYIFENSIFKKQLWTTSFETNEKKKNASFFSPWYYQGQ